MSKRTHYDVLGVLPDASAADIRRAYRRLARRHHPDVSPSADPVAFRSVCEAYELLSDEARRRDYDRRLLEADKRERADRVSCGDEIAIDFPSVSSLFDRVWWAFVDQAERPVPVRAEIELSRDEALHGVRVPLAVPVRAICPRCGGSGECWLDTCGRCAGLGEHTVRHHVTIALPPGLRGGEHVAFTLTGAGAPATPVELRICVR